MTNENVYDPAHPVSLKLVLMLHVQRIFFMLLLEKNSKAEIVHIINCKSSMSI